MGAQERRDLLSEASDVVADSRVSGEQYGSPEDSFTAIAEHWTTYLRSRPVGSGAEITAADVALMMILLKVVRLASNPAHHDSAVDVAGYAACLHDVVTAGARKGDGVRAA